MLSCPKTTISPLDKTAIADIFVFDSYYKLDGNILTVTADEHYRENIVAPEDYEEYRKVINSAADFNKVTLVFEKK